MHGWLPYLLMSLSNISENFLTTPLKLQHTLRQTPASPIPSPHLSLLLKHTCCLRILFIAYLAMHASEGIGVLYWTRTWWSGDNDERVKEGKRLVLPGSRSGLPAPGNPPEIERERETRGPKLWWNKGALLNSVRVYTLVASSDKDWETRLYKFTKAARSNRGHKAKRRSKSKEGGK